MPNMPPKTKKIIESVVESIEEIKPEPIEETFAEEDTITFKRSHFYSALSIFTFFAGILVGYVIWGTGLLSQSGIGSGAATQANGLVVEAPVTAEPQYTRYNIPITGSYALGPADAPSPLWNSVITNVHTIVGAQPNAVFKQIIDKELAGEIPTN